MMLWNTYCKRLMQLTTMNSDCTVSFALLATAEPHMQSPSAATTSATVVDHVSIDESIIHRNVDSKSYRLSLSVVTDVRTNPCTVHLLMKWNRRMV